MKIKLPSCLFFVITAFLFINSGCGIQKPGYSKHPVNFSFEMNKKQFRVSEFRGDPLLIVLVRISEISSELFLKEIQKTYMQTKGKVQFMVLSIDSNDAPMLNMFEKFHQYPFHIGLAQVEVSLGKTELGIIPIVPSAYLLNDKGTIVDMAAGVVPAQNIINSINRL